MITLQAVLLEADKVRAEDESRADDQDEDTGTDYTDTGDEETDAPADDDTGADDGGDDNPPADDAGGGDEDIPPDDEGGDDTGTDYTDDEGANDGGDNGEPDDGNSGDPGGMDSGDSGSSGVESEDQIRERDMKVKSILLLQEMSRLYHAVKTYITKVTNMEKKNVLFSAIQKTVIDNFNKLTDLIYNYIQYYYDHMAYEYNLYSYHYFVEICRVNLELLKKVSAKDDVEY